MGVKMFFRVRGIYATALTTLLMKRGHEPTQPSKTIASRLSLTPLTVPPQLDIYDLPSREGVVVEGGDRPVEEALNILLEELPDVHVKEREPRLNSVYKGLVEEASNDGCYVNLGGARGLLPRQRLREGEEVVVTVVKHLSDSVILSPGIRVVGSYAKLIEGHGTSLSRGLKGSRRAGELLALGKAIKPQRWGIRWRRSAAYAPIDKLIEEVEALKRRAEECVEKASKLKAPSLILEGDRVVELRFYGASLRRLDEARSTVCPTMPRHHVFKTWGRPYSSVVDLIEDLGLPRPLLKQVSGKMMSRVFKPGTMVSIVHVKPQGSTISLTPGRVVTVEEDLIKLERVFKKGGTYNGLGVPKEEGDRGLTVFKEGCWAYYTAYFSSSGELKGVYFNIATPPTYRPGEVRYLDLLVDVSWTPGEGAKMIDVDELQRAVEEGWLCKSLANRAMEAATRLIKMLASAHPLLIDLSKLDLDATFN